MLPAFAESPLLPPAQLCTLGKSSQSGVTGGPAIAFPLGKGDDPFPPFCTPSFDSSDSYSFKLKTARLQSTAVQGSPGRPPPAPRLCEGAGGFGQEVTGPG